MWHRPGDRNGVKVPPYSEETMPTLREGTSVISLRLAYRRKTTDYNQKVSTRPSFLSLDSDDNPESFTNIYVVLLGFFITFLSSDLGSRGGLKYS
jgi:hypothetical protein